MTQHKETPPLSSKLTKMKRQPFGVRDDGTSVDEIDGNLVTAPVEYLQEVVAGKARDLSPANSTQAEIDRLVERNRSAALERLVAMINDAIPDERFRISPDYLLNSSNKYSTEFWAFTLDYCRVISEDPDFFEKYYQQVRIPPILVSLFRPFSTSTIFKLLPQIVRKIANADVRVSDVTPTSAVLRWYGRRQEDPNLNEIHLTLSSMTYRSLMSAIPEQVHGQPPATVVETTSMLDGHDYYQWTFSWQRAPSNYSRWFLLGGFTTLLLLFIHLWIGLPLFLLLIITLLSPLLLGWTLYRFSKLGYDHHRKETLLEEQRNLAEEQYDQSQQAKAELQALNVELRRKVDEFKALHDISLAISATLDLDQLIERILVAVTTNLHYDRAMILLADEERQVLGRGQGVGDSPELLDRVRGFELPFDDRENFLVNLYFSDAPVLIEEIPPDETSPNYRLAQVLGTHSHLGTPLFSKGRRVGILNVDNNRTKRPIREEEVDLIFTVAGQIAVAIDNALLYQEVEAQKETLEHRVERRTRELAQATAEAQEARTIAEEANEAKSTFLSNVSHELRTPLTSVLGFTKLIKKALNRHILPNVQNDGARVNRAVGNVQENLDIIIQEGERLTALINDVLDLAKIEAGKVEWDLQPTRVAAVIDRALTATDSLARDKKLRLRTEIEDDLPDIIGDRDKLIQVIINLLSNAVKFTDQGEIVCRAVNTGNEIVVSVIDNGAGIAQGDVPKLFAMFRQVGDALTDKPRGTGLGLAISKEIVEFHGGRIWVESEIGAGSTFSFSLPVGDGRHL